MFKIFCAKKYPPNMLFLVNLPPNQHLKPHCSTTKNIYTNQVIDPPSGYRAIVLGVGGLSKSGSCPGVCTVIVMLPPRCNAWKTGCSKCIAWWPT